MHWAARRMGMMAFEAADVRLEPGLIVIPDLVVAETDNKGTWITADDVVMLGEIVSPGNAKNDRLLKMNLYADAKIPWYLLIEPDDETSSVTLRMLKLQGEHYVEHRVHGPGETFEFDEPFPYRIDADELTS
jgi:Uma2 family endonuclease